MLWPFPSNTKITGKWDEPRPMSNPGKHVHGAIDIGLKSGSKIIAPEKGTLNYYFAVRNKDGQFWPNGEMNNFPYRNYFYDMFGGIAVLHGKSGITHVFCHLYMNPMYNKSDHMWKYKEQKQDTRFPLFCFMSHEMEVFEGAAIGVTGNSGYSTAPHCHYEMHDGFVWQLHGDRPDPEEVDWEEFK